MTPLRPTTGSDWASRRSLQRLGLGVMRRSLLFTTLENEVV